ncbi:uncharacterized protein EAE97_003032 [Botrytis byssoidea]|uniref:Uncharacterized protein n=1 Tax=Botrytis byssoidea TaxID=139641 RepID=A0A9P5IPP0_9HELO|nr:uncharacterized protein EAE97_003032 [Botrytis byssoidea]KAF7949523.1 hypothetical protein EAE97_003032 [Botrytis byssoidea]
MVTFQDRIATLDNQVREKEETLHLYQERFGILKRDDWGPDEDLNAGDSVSEFEWKAEQKDIRDGQMNTSNYQQMGGANGDRPFYVFVEHNRPADIKEEQSFYGPQMDSANNEHPPPRGNQHETSGCGDRGGGVTGSGKTISTRRNHLGANVYAPHAQQSQPSTSTFDNFKPSNPNPGSHKNPRIKQESIFGGFNRLAKSAHLSSTHNQSQPELLLKQESIFGSPSRSITQRPNATLHSNTSTFYNFNPAVSKQPPKVLPKEESIFGGYDRFAGNAYSGSQQPHQSQPRSPIKEESMFDGVNGCILQQPSVLLNAVTTTFGDFQHHLPLNTLTQPLQEESMLSDRFTGVVNELPDTYRQSRMSNSGAPRQPERALDNMIKTEEEEEPSQPSTSIPRPPKPIVSVAENLLGDPSSPKVLKDRAKTEAICEKAKGPLPPTIQPKTMPNGRKAGVLSIKKRNSGPLECFSTLIRVALTVAVAIMRARCV